MSLGLIRVRVLRDSVDGLKLKVSHQMISQSRFQLVFKALNGVSVRKFELWYGMVYLDV